MRIKQAMRVFLILFSLHLAISQTPAFNFDTGNAPVQVVIPTVVPRFQEDVGKGASDATIVLRTTALVTNAWFDAIAPYHPTAIGVYTQHNHRLTEPTNKNKNIALLYASYHILCSLFPKRAKDWGQMLKNVGLDPLLQSDDVNTPEGLGIIAGKKVAQVRQQDGMNQLGDMATRMSKRKYNRIPYSDYTGYTPKNTPHELKDPSSWQPTLTSTGIGLFKSQQFVTPQMRFTTPYSFQDPKIFRTPKPKNSDVKNFQGYYAQALHLIDASANLDTYKKLRSEYFDNKFRSLGFSAGSASILYNSTLAQFVHLDFLTNVASFDTAIVVWQEKQRHNAVRPWTAIAYLWKNQPISSWGGPGKGLVFDLPANEWRSYLNTADHPEYPSGSASFCAAHTLVARKFFKNDTLNLKIPYLKGQSVRQPGVTPPSDTFIEFKTWTDFNAQCGQSRIWGGVHFPDAVSAGRDIGYKVGQIVYDFVMSHINGTAKKNEK